MSDGGAAITRSHSGGIYARTLLPSPAYDHMFEVYRSGDGWRCHLKRDGSIKNDMPDWWEDVPAPEGTSA